MKKYSGRKEGRQAGRRHLDQKNIIRIKKNIFGQGKEGRKGKERKGKRKGKEKGKERKGKRREGKERKEKGREGQGRKGRNIYVYIYRLHAYI